jgi:hypothetical protein
MLANLMASNPGALIRLFPREPISMRFGASSANESPVD